jgi:hypothetical protein
MKSAGRKRLVGYLQSEYHVGQRRACRLIAISRKAIWYQSVRPDRDADLIKRLKQLAEQYPRYGYLMLHELLRREGLVTNRKRTYRIYSELGMQVRTKRRKRLIRPRIPLEVPTAPHQRWSLDFVHDQLADGRRIRVLNVVDDYSRVCVGQLVDLSISGERLARFLTELGSDRRLPRRIVMDNGPEMTSIWRNGAPRGHVLCERGECFIAELCRKEGINQNLYYRWSKDFLEAGKRRLSGDTAREANTDEVTGLKRENQDLKQAVAELYLRNDWLKKV